MTITDNGGVGGGGGGTREELVCNSPRTRWIRTCYEEKTRTEGLLEVPLVTRDAVECRCSVVSGRFHVLSTDSEGQLVVMSEPSHNKRGRLVIIRRTRTRSAEPNLETRNEFSGSNWQLTLFASNSSMYSSVPCRMMRYTK